MLRRKSGSSIIGAVLAWIVLLVYLVWTVFPFAWMLSTSLKSREIIFKPFFLPFIQFQPTLENWYNVLIKGEYFPKAFMNSLTIAGFSALISVTIGLLAGYGLSRFKFKRWKNRDISVWILSQRMMPPVAVIIPYFLIMKTLGLLDTPLALIIAHSVFNVPLAVWLMMDFFGEIPVELEEAALVDGCSRRTILLRITLPLSLPGLIAVYVLCFIFSWNELLFALTLTYNKAYTLPVLIAGTLAFQQMEWWNLAVYTTLTIIPPVTLALAFERYLVRGLTWGAVKL